MSTYTLGQWGNHSGPRSRGLANTNNVPREYQESKGRILKDENCTLPYIEPTPKDISLIGVEYMIS